MKRLNKISKKIMANEKLYADVNVVEKEFKAITNLAKSIADNYKSSSHFNVQAHLNYDFAPEEPFNIELSFGSASFLSADINEAQQYAEDCKNFGADLEELIEECKNFHYLGYYPTFK